MPKDLTRMTLSERSRDRKLIDRAIKRAVREALADSRRAKPARKRAKTTRSRPAR